MRQRIRAALACDAMAAEVIAMPQICVAQGMRACNMRGSILAGEPAWAGQAEGTGACASGA
ncbi:hypothetical protein [Dankookia sp. P2]|uniref:hypothetical protein n=1 Tax=Dankookia sp. P2 TaxID=3423955 RepID=UPI003D677814